MSNSLSVEQLRGQLSALGVDNRGHRNELKARLRRQQQRQQHHVSPNPIQQHTITSIQQRRPIAAGPGGGNGSNGNGSSQADSATSWRRVGAPEPVIVLKPLAPPLPPPPPSEPVNVTWKPIMDSYLVLDVEATCERGKLGQPRKSSFEFPNESEL